MGFNRQFVHRLMSMSHFIRTLLKTIFRHLPLRRVHSTWGFPEKLRTTYEAFMDEDLERAVKEIVGSHLDLPKLQPAIPNFTDVLYYNYDFGDDWMVRITASMDAGDLVEQGRFFAAGARLSNGNDP